MRAPRSREGIRAAGVAVAITGLSVALLVPKASDADAASATKCTGKVPSVMLDPGLEATKHISGTFHNNGTGPVECAGPVLGKTPTGPGVFTHDAGKFEGSCAKGGKGVFTLTFRIPTKNGTVELVNTGPFTFGALQGGVVGGEYSGNAERGSFSVLPKKGDCVTSPITELAVDFKMTLK